MRRAQTYARDFGAVIDHATQDRDLSSSGVMNEGLFASWLGLPGIPREAEAIPLERDMMLARLTRGHHYRAASTVSQYLSAIDQPDGIGQRCQRVSQLVRQHGEKLVLALIGLA